MRKEKQDGYCFPLPKGISSCLSVSFANSLAKTLLLPGLLENKQGTGGSVRVYMYLLDLFGGEITRQAAHFGCAIYAEHTGMYGTEDRWC